MYYSMYSCMSVFGPTLYELKYIYVPCEIIKFSLRLYAALAFSINYYSENVSYLLIHYLI